MTLSEYLLFFLGQWWSSSSNFERPKPGLGRLGGCLVCPVSALSKIEIWPGQAGGAKSGKDLSQEFMCSGSGRIASIEMSIAKNWGERNTEDKGEFPASDRHVRRKPRWSSWVSRVTLEPAKSAKLFKSPVRPVNSEHKASKLRIQMLQWLYVFQNHVVDFTLSAVNQAGWPLDNTCSQSRQRLRKSTNLQAQDWTLTAAIAWRYQRVLLRWLMRVVWGWSLWRRQSLQVSECVVNAELLCFYTAQKTLKHTFAAIPQACFCVRLGGILVTQTFVFASLDMAGIVSLHRLRVSTARHRLLKFWFQRELPRRGPWRWKTFNHTWLHSHTIKLWSLCQKVLWRRATRTRMTLFSYSTSFGQSCQTFV